MAEEKSKKITKVKKKRWVEVFSPALFKNELIGEIPVSEPKSVLGRTISVNLMGLTRDMKKQNTQIRFIITSLNGDKAVADFYGYYLNPSSIKRLVRKGKEKLAISATCRTADNKKVRVMPLIIPYSKVKGSIAAALRKDAFNFLTDYIAKTTFENIIKDLISNNLQRELKTALKKIYPIRVLEIGKLHLETDKKPVEKKAEEKEEKAEKEIEEKTEEAKEEVKEEEKKAKEKEVKAETEEEKEVEQKEETEEEDEPEEELGQEPEE